uniref:type I phosphomannose isomerase catalytic subunit n=1 Tax=Jeotgalibaca porci TaxID=1868793 RepID=UPI0035A06B5E
MIQPLFMQPVLQEKMWGGTKLRDIYGYSIPSDHTGECWAISAHPDGVGKIAIGTFAGMGLDELYQAHPELFGNPSSPVFPLLTKIIDAADALSVQVHPDDAYGMEHEGELGKTECWYIIDADEGAEIIYGHNALSKEEFAEMVQEGKWSDLLRYVPVKRGDFFFVPSGTIHAIGAGITILETQQSSNTTYRVYDFDRVEQNGQKRDLHIQESIDVTAFPHVDAVNHFKVDGMVTTFIESDYFNVYKWDITESFTYRQTAAYTLVSVLE